jgi:hypothetical protein
MADNGAGPLGRRDVVNRRWRRRRRRGGLKKIRGEKEDEEMTSQTRKPMCSHRIAPPHSCGPHHDEEKKEGRKNSGREIYAIPIRA